MTVSDVWGLVVNEAMANGLPIITTNMCVAGLDLVENGKNGFILGVGDYNGLTRAITELFDFKTRNKMSKESLTKIQEYTIENMGTIHKKIFEELYDDKQKNY